MEVRVIRGPDGGILHLLGLPQKGFQRWVASKKAAVVCAIQAGKLSREEAKSRWRITDEELASWERQYRNYGIGGLEVTRLQEFRGH